MQGGIQNDVIKAEVVFKAYGGYAIKGIFLLVKSFAVKCPVPWWFGIQITIWEMDQYSDAH